MTGDPLPHYYICEDCANERGGKVPLGALNTAHLDNCPYCDELKTLLSIYDFDGLRKSKKTGKKLKHVFD